MSGQDAARDHIPVIDVGPLVAKTSGQASRLAVAREMGEACRDVGLFYICNHYIPEHRRIEGLEEAQRFFAQDEVRKSKLGIATEGQFRGYVRLGGEVTQGKRDWHECIDLQPLFRDGHPANFTPADRIRNGHPLDDTSQWPEGQPNFRRVMMATWDDMWGLAEALTEGLALSLGLPPNHFHPFIGTGLSSLRLAHYPAFDGSHGRDVDAGMGAHCDNGFLTILCQDGADGLEVRLPEGKWVSAPHRPETYLVNIGLMMQRWTNDLYTATWHRVSLPKDSDRYSIPFFFEPRHDAVVTPLAACCTPETPPRYEACVFGEHLDRIFATAYRSPQAKA